MKLGFLLTGLVSASTAGFGCTSTSSGSGGTGSSSGSASSSSGGGTVITLASNQMAAGNGGSGADAIAVDATSVYFAVANGDESPTPLTGFIAKVPLAGGTVSTLVTAIDPRNIAIDAQSLYWTDNAAVYKVPLSGGSVTTVATEQGAASLAVDAADVYFVTNQYHTVEKVPVGGGTPSTLYTGTGDEAGIAISATDVYWTENALEGNDYQYTVNKLPLAGGSAPEVLAMGAGVPNAPIAVDGTRVYFPWSDDSDPNNAMAAILSVPIAGGSTTTLTSGMNVNHVAALAVDSTNLYFGNQGNALLARVPLAGGAPVTLTDGASMITALAVDSSDVYWTVPSPNTVLRMAK